MVFRPQLRFIYGQTGWMLAVLVIMALLGNIDINLFFMLSFVGFFVLIESIDPFRGDPKLRARLRWIAIIGMLVFGYILLDRLFEVLAEELP